MEQRLVRISVEVRSGRPRFRVGVRSIREVLALVGGRYPRREVGDAFPVEPEGFFVREIDISGSGHLRASSPGGRLRDQARRGEGTRRARKRTQRLITPTQN